MITARYLALTLCVAAIAPALAAPVPLGDPFYVRHGASVELTQGATVKLVGVRDERCPTDVMCVWQGEAFVEIELQVKGQTARGSITTEKPDGTLLAHNVKLLGLYPAPRSSEQRPAKESVAFLLVADATPGSVKAFANRAAASAFASNFVDAFGRAANDVCASWQQRKLDSYLRDSAALCDMIGKAARTAHAFNEDADSWRFFFLIDNPQMRTEMNESLYLLVALPKAPEHAADRVRNPDVVLLPCDATLLDATKGGCNASPR